MARTERLHVRMTLEERAALSHDARLEDRSMSDWVRTAIRQRLGRELQRRQELKAVGGSVSDAVRSMTSPSLSRPAAQSPQTDRSADSPLPPPP